MPVGAAAVTAAGVVAAGYLQKRSSDNANKSQERSTGQALQYQKDRQSIEDQRYDAAWQDYLTRHKAWEQRNFGGGGGQTATPKGNSGAVEMSGMNLGSLLGQPQGPGSANVLPGSVPEADQQKISGWGDWGRYGAGGL